jgi:hypothetical protein
LGRGGGGKGWGAFEEKGLASAGAASWGGEIPRQMLLARWDGVEGPRALVHAMRRGTAGRVGEGRARGGREEGRRSVRNGGFVLLVQCWLRGEGANAGHSGGMGRVMGGGRPPRSRRRPAIVVADKPGSEQIERPFGKSVVKDFRGRWSTTFPPTRCTR